MLVSVDHVPFRVRCPNMREEAYLGDSYNPDAFKVAGDPESESFAEKWFGLRRVSFGVYEGLNFHSQIDGLLVSRGYGGFTAPEPPHPMEKHAAAWRRYWNSTMTYGVADDIPQIMAYYKKEIKDRKRQWVISVCPIIKKEEYERGGWRWHKWGTYIGTQVPTTEYIYDEPLIEQVLVYHIHEVRLPDAYPMPKVKR